MRDARVVGAASALVRTEQTPVAGGGTLADEVGIDEAVRGSIPVGEEHREALARVMRGIRFGEFGKQRFRQLAPLIGSRNSRHTHDRFVPRGKRAKNSRVKRRSQSGWLAIPHRTERNDAKTSYCDYFSVSHV